MKVYIYREVLVEADDPLRPAVDHLLGLDDFSLGHPLPVMAPDVCWYNFAPMENFAYERGLVSHTLSGYSPMSAQAVEKLVVTMARTLELIEAGDFDEAAAPWNLPSAAMQQPGILTGLWEGVNKLGHVTGTDPHTYYLAVAL